MYQIDQVKTGLFGLVGWRQDTVSGIPTIDATNLASSSGMYYQDFASMVTIQNIYDCQEDAEISDANFNTLLTDLSKASIVKVLNAVYSSEDYIENKVLYPYEKDWINTIDNTTSFVGFEIDCPVRKDLLWTINKIFTSFDTAGDTVKILLFSSNKNAPLQSKEITTEQLTDTETDLDWDLSKFDNAGGKFYIGYLRSGLTAKAIDREFELANRRACFNTLKITPIIVSDWDAETLFDVNNIENVSETFGLNFDITAWKDYTNVIVKNKNKFTNAIGYQVAADVLDLILNATRSNRIQRLKEGHILFELEGLVGEGLPRTVGVNQKLAAEIKELRENFIEIPPLQRSTLR
jgi:hypothetical protein